MLKLVKELSKKPRVAGSKRDKGVIKYLKNKLEQSNHKIRLQIIPFTGWELVKKSELKVNGKKLKCLPVVWSGSGKIKGKLVKTTQIKTFEAYPWKRYKIVDKNRVKGHIITRPDIVWLQPLNRPSKTPYFMVYPNTCKLIEKLMEEKKEVWVEASVKSKFTKTKITNIITKNKSKKRIVICAHYDSVPFSPGAGDNATGTASLLEIAKEKGQDVQFILFGAEEWNKYGSYAYVRSLTKKQLKQIKAVVNIDMVASKDRYVMCSKKFKSIIKEIVGKKTPISTEIRAPFDIWPFHKKGVPIVHFGSAYGFCHSPKDTIDKIDFAAIEKTTRLIKKVVDEIRQYRSVKYINYA